MKVSQLLEASPGTKSHLVVDMFNKLSASGKKVYFDARSLSETGDDPAFLYPISKMSDRAIHFTNEKGNSQTLVVTSEILYKFTIVKHKNDSWLLQAREDN